MGRDQLLTSVSGRGRQPRLPFIGLVEAQFYKGLRNTGLSMQAINSGMVEVRRALGDRMLAKGVIAHDGKDILMNLADRGDPDWVRARDRQGGLPEIIEIGLKPIEWAADGLPQRVRLIAYGDNMVAADPRVALGQPFVVSSGARVEDIIDLFRAGEDLATVSHEMGVNPRDVEAIVRAHLPLAA
jgi:uncharacterized protein (DUF433 family)